MPETQWPQLTGRRMRECKRDVSLIFTPNLIAFNAQVVVVDGVRSTVTSDTMYYDCHILAD